MEVKLAPLTITPRNSFQSSAFQSYKSWLCWIRGLGSQLGYPPTREHGKGTTAATWSLQALHACG